MTKLSLDTQDRPGRATATGEAEAADRPEPPVRPRLLRRAGRGVLMLLGGAFSLLTLGTLSGLLGLSALFWFFSKDLPSYDELAGYAPETISRVYSGEGRVIDEFAVERRLFASSHEIPELVKQAFISAEDKNFYTHPGYDTRGMAAAAYEAIATGGRDVRGASTITQQVMKNFLLDNSRSVERKIKEIILASRIEQSMEKEKILELYLNEIFLGQNSYGVTAAAQTFFNKSLDDLEVHEIAYLAAVPKAPSNYHPVRHRARAVERRNFVLREMFENGFIDQDDYQRAVAEPLATVQNGDFASFRSERPPRNFFTDEIRRQLSRDLGEEDFFSGGYTVRATVDPELQRAAEIALRRGLETYDRARGVWRGTGLEISDDILGDEAAWRAALADLELARDIYLDGVWRPAVVLSVGANDARIGIEGVPDDENGHFITSDDVTWAQRRRGDGSLAARARVVGDLLRQGEVIYVRAQLDAQSGEETDNWTARQIPEVQGAFTAMDVNTGRVLALQGGFSFQQSVFNRATQARRQPGSAFKPFVYAAALDSGYSPATILVDAPITIDTPQGLWEPQNYSEQFFGPTPIRTGIERSRNLMTIRLAQEVGMDTIAEYAQRFGVYDNMQQVLSASLGANETTLYRLTASYAMFANGGERIEPTLVDRVQDRYGRTIYRHDQRICLDCTQPTLTTGRLPSILSDRERVLDPITAFQITQMMAGVVERGTARRTVNLDVPIAGKTGTTNEARDAWFVGFSSNIVAGCFIGYDQPRSLGARTGGGTLCGPVFNDFMQVATRKYGGGRFIAPPGGEFINIDRFTGERLPDDAEGDNVVAEYFRRGEQPVFGVTFDGGFAMAANLPIINPDDEEQSAQTAGSSIDAAISTPAEAGPAPSGGPSTGPTTTTFGTLSSGGLY